MTESNTPQNNAPDESTHFNAERVPDFARNFTDFDPESESEFAPDFDPRHHPRFAHAAEKMFERGFGAGFRSGFGRGFKAHFGPGDEGDFGGFGRGFGGFGGGFGRGGGPGDERRGRGKRPFDHGQMRIAILALIAEKPRHGYDIIKTIEDRFGGIYSPSPGVVYPTLTLLEEMGYTTVQEGVGKKLYTITPEGEAYLKVHPQPGGPMRGEAPPDRGVTPELMRALHDLRGAVRARYRKGAPTPEQAAEIVKVLEQAANAIERL